MAISNEVMNLLGENPGTELEDIKQEIADLQKDILAGVKAHRDITGLAERVQQLRSRKTEIEAGQAVEDGIRNALRLSANPSRSPRIRCSLMMKNWFETLSRRSRSFLISLPSR